MRPITIFYDKTFFRFFFFKLIAHCNERPCTIELICITNEQVTFFFGQLQASHKNMEVSSLSNSPPASNAGAVSSVKVDPPRSQPISVAAKKDCVNEDVLSPRPDHINSLSPPSVTPSNVLINKICRKIHFFLKKVWIFGQNWLKFIF